MSAKHTPGPWTVLDDDGDLHIVGPMPASRVWVENVVATVREGGNYPLIEANARLIAAAPELLEALERALEEAADPHADDCNSTSGCTCHVKGARAALAKAKGETP